MKGWGYELCSSVGNPHETSKSSCSLTDFKSEISDSVLFASFQKYASLVYVSYFFIVLVWIKNKQVKYIFPLHEEATKVLRPHTLSKDVAVPQLLHLLRNWPDIEFI